jgi:S1-C subfamily serine protease
MDGYPTGHDPASEWSFAEPLGTPLPQTKRPRRRLLPGAVATGMLVTAGLGVVIGHLTWGSSSVPTTTSIGGRALAPRANGNPFGGFSPFTGNSAASGSGSNTSGGPANASSIATGVDPGLVDINTVLGDSGNGGQAAGTGMVITSNGEILTNNHVIEGATAISVTDIGNGRTYSARVVGYDTKADVAVLQLINASGLKTVTTANSSSVKVGDQVVAIGNAGGTGGTPSYAGGTITATNQSITATDDASGTNEQLAGLLATNADIQPGDSGGPLVNTSGAVLGMDTAGSSTSGFSFQPSASTQGFAIPINTALEVAHKIDTYKASTASIHVGKTAFLGVQVTSPGSANAGGGFGGGNSYCPGYEFPGFFQCSSTESPNGSGSSTTTPPTTGAEIAGTIAGQPAANAGLSAGDTIVSVNGKSVTNLTLSTALLQLKPGDTAAIGYVTATGQHESVNVRLASGPPQ